MTMLATSRPRKKSSISSSTGIGSSIRTILHKCKANLKKVAHEALGDSSSDGESTTVDALFDGDTVKEESCLPQKSVQRISEDGNSSTSATQTGEMRLTDENESGDTISLEEEVDTQGKTNAVQTFANYNPVEECTRLRSEFGEPFIQGELIWRRRRELWTTRPDNSTKCNESQQHRSSFDKVSPQYYTRIYKKLVLDNKPLRQPLNLQDAMRVINAGWVETNKWERASKGLA